LVLFKSPNNPVLDNNRAEIWRELVLASIGEQFHSVLDKDDEVTGVTINIRTRAESIIRIWNRKADANVEALREKVVELVPYDIRQNSLYRRACVVFIAKSVLFGC